MTITTTTWHRLEPRVRGTDPAVGLRAAVHDPLWLLGRQWQMGELLGEDAAFPVAVRVETGNTRSPGSSPEPAQRATTTQPPPRSRSQSSGSRQPHQPCANGSTHGPDS